MIAGRQNSAKTRKSQARQIKEPQQDIDASQDQQEIDLTMTTAQRQV